MSYSYHGAGRFITQNPSVSQKMHCLNLSCQSNSIHWEDERALGDTKCINAHMTKNCENRFIFLSHFLVLQVVLYSGYWLLQGSSLSIQLFSYLVQETTQEQKKDVTIRSPNSTFRPSAKSYLRNHCLLLMAIPASQSSITDHNRRVICSYLIYVWHCITNFRHLSFSTSVYVTGEDHTEKQSQWRKMKP